MKENIAYIFGRCYGLQNMLAGPKYDPTAKKIQDAVQRPLSGFAAINSYLVANGKMTEEANKRIAELVSEVKDIDLEPGEPEPILPLELQSSWWLGYYHEIADHQKKNPIRREIKTYGETVVQRRKAKGISQVELAEKVGTQQSTIARIERGQMLPDKWMSKIDAALSDDNDVN